MAEKLNRLKEVLVSKDMSQKELAEKWGRSERHVSKICTNENQPPLTELKKIADILGVDIIELIVSTKSE